MVVFLVCLFFAFPPAECENSSSFTPLSIPAKVTFFAGEKVLGLFVYLILFIFNGGTRDQTQDFMHTKHITLPLSYTSHPP